MTAGLRSLAPTGQATRAVLVPRGVAVHGFYPAGIDADMLAGVDEPKEDPATVAAALLDGREADQADIWPPSAHAPMTLYLCVTRRRSNAPWRRPLGSRRREGRRSG